MRVRFVRDDGEKLEIGGASGLVNGGTDDWFPAKPLRTSQFNYADADGGQMVKQHYDPWTITFSGYIRRHGPALIRESRNDLLHFFANNHYFTAIFTDCTGTEMAGMSGWVSSAPQVVLRGKLDAHPTFTLQLTFGDPFLYEYAEDEEGNPIYAHSITVPKYVDTSEGEGYMYSGSGYIYFGGGYAYIGQQSQIPTINVDSIQAVAPVWKVAGLATNPTITNLTTNTEMSYSGTIAEGQTLVVDCLNQTAMIGTADVSRYLSGDWLTLVPGDNQLQYESTGKDDAESSTLEWNGVIW